MKFRPIIIWYQKKKKKLLNWIDETNIFLYFCRKVTYVYLFYNLLFNFKLNIIFSLFISYAINRFCWDILITWFYIDYIYGIIYKNTENLKNFINMLKKIKNKFLMKSYNNIKKKKNYKYIINFIVYIYIFIIFIFIVLKNYNIQYVHIYILYIYMYIYIYIYNYNINSKLNYINYIYSLVINKILYCNHSIKHKFIKLYNIYIYTIKSLLIKIIEFILNIYVYSCNKYFKLVNNKLSFEEILEYKIYIYNKKLKIKQIKYKIYLFLIYFLDNFEYHLIKNKILYKNKNIIKLKKLSKNLTPIKSKIELKLKLKQTYLLNSIKIYSQYYIDIVINCFNVYQIKFNNKLKFTNKLKLNKDIVNNYISISKLNRFILIIYTPINWLNYIMSDISLTITYLLIYFKKKYILNIFIIYIYLLVNKINYFLNYNIKLTVKYTKQIIYFIISKTIYIILIFCYFYNKDLSIYLLYNVYNEFIFNWLIFKNNFLLFNILFNVNCMYVWVTILGLQIVLYWSKNIHKLFGRYLWTMTIFPIFLESHKILYYKLICINLLNFNTFDFIFLLKYRVLELFNYKIYNIYQTFTIIILIFLFIFFIRIGAFKHIYASLLNSRWKYAKYPMFIYIIEISRLKIIEYLSLFILYLNLKYNIYNYILKFLLNLSNNSIFIYMLDFIQEFILELNEFNYYNLYVIFIPNMFILNIIIDVCIIWISIKWLITYLNYFKKIDLKFVAFPLVTTEIILKYYFIYLFIYYFSQYIYIWIIDSTILWHLFRVSLISLIYLEIRVHKIPRKTMPWYFRQIVELWPSTYLNQWYTSEYLYIDQQRYIVLRFRLKTFKLTYKDTYKKLEVWNKIIILNYQKEKDKTVRQLMAFCRVMSRKENMLREINNFEYQGWYEDWEYNHHKINIYSWKLDIWDKPYMYQFKKTVFFSNIKFHFFFYNTLLERYSMKYMHLTYLFFFTNLLDFYYTQIYIFIFDKDETSNLSLKAWKKKFYNSYDEVEEYIHLKKLKLVLMGFSSGETIKTPDWIFPPIYEKRYKKEGWSMFENQEIDQVELDWRPNIKDLN